MRNALLTALLCSLISAQALTGPQEQVFRKALAAQQQGNFAAAADLYRQVLNDKPGFLDARVNLAISEVHLGQFDDAIHNYEIALPEAPQEGPLRMNLGLAYYKKGDFPKAEQQFGSLLKEDAGNVRAAILDADCLSKMGQNGRAVEILSPLRNSHPGDLDLAYVLGTALLRSGQEDQGVALLEQVGREGHSADAYFLAGSTMLGRNEGTQSLQKRAIDDLRAADGLDPQFPGLTTKLGIAEEGAGNQEKAEALLRQALKRDPNDFDASIHLGGVLYSKRNLEEARVFVQLALTLRPDSAFALYELALIEVAEGKTAEAVQNLETVVRKTPDWVEPHIQLSVLYYKLHRADDGLRERRVVDSLKHGQ